MKNIDKKVDWTLSKLIPTQKEIPEQNNETKVKYTKVASFEVEIEDLKMIKAWAYRKRKQIKDTVSIAFKSFLESLPADELAEAVKVYNKEED